MDHIIGRPLYKEDDKVSFELNTSSGARVKYTGTVYIVDAFGTFEQNEEPSYDIMVENWLNTGGQCLMKHIRESWLVLEK